MLCGLFAAGLGLGINYTFGFQLTDLFRNKLYKQQYYQQGVQVSYQAWLCIENKWVIISVI